MKTQKTTWPIWIKVGLYFLILSLAYVTAGLVPALNSFIFFFLVSLVSSWAFLHAEGNTLSSLGFVPLSKKDWANLFQGLAAGVFLLFITLVITLYLTKDNWEINPHLDPVHLLMTFLGCLFSAFIQEFVFRGYPFQSLLKQYAPWLAQLIIAIPFGLMHLHASMTLWDMLKVMISTGLGSVLFGLAYLKSEKLFLPIGLHLGWNYAQELLPRVAMQDQHHKGLILLSGNESMYNDLNVLMPYLLVISIAVVYFVVTGRKKNEPLGHFL